ncbi:MAG: hypothetical protein N3A69_14685, partial [Leptospiraceae bacterium]|nr:hypothetical protein [Leptospiraceae bacterium]
EQDHLRTNSSPRQDLWVDIESSTDDEGELTFMSTTSISEDSFEVLSSAESHLTKNSDLDLSPQSVSRESSLSTILDSSQENDNPQN